MARYKVYFGGFYIVDADNELDVISGDYDPIYNEYEPTHVEEIDEDDMFY